MCTRRVTFRNELSLFEDHVVDDDQPLLVHLTLVAEGCQVD
jgi:hypothetical protein